MGLSSTQSAVLEDLAATIPDDVRWCVFGSAGAVLLGLDGDPSDVDVLTTAAGAERIRAALGEAFVGTRSLGGSQIDDYRLRGEEVEVVYAESATGGQEPLVDLSAVTPETTAERDVPVLPPSALVASYRRMGKPEAADRLAAQFAGRDV